MRHYWNRCVFSLTSFGMQVLKLIGVQIPKKQQILLSQFIGFSLVGCTNVVITLSIYYVLIACFGSKVYLVAQSVGYGAGIINSYFVNRLLVFVESKSPPAQSFLKSCISYLMTYFIQIGLLFGLVQILEVSEHVAPIIVVVATIPLNFLLNKFWAFS